MATQAGVGHFPIYPLPAFTARARGRGARTTMAAFPSREGHPTLVQRQSKRIVLSSGNYAYRDKQGRVSAVYSLRREVAKLHFQQQTPARSFVSPEICRSVPVQCAPATPKIQCLVHPYTYM